MSGYHPGLRRAGLGDDTSLDSLSLDTSGLDSLDALNTTDASSLSLAPDLSSDTSSSLPFGLPNITQTNVSTPYGDIGSNGVLTVTNASGTPVQVGQFDSAGNFSQTGQQTSNANSINWGSLLTAADQVVSPTASLINSLSSQSANAAGAGTTPQPSASSFFSGSTTIDGYAIPNIVLVLGGAGAVLLLMSSGKKRRR